MIPTEDIYLIVGLAIGTAGGFYMGWTSKERQEYPYGKPKSLSATPTMNEPKEPRA
jgi:hypothetical protein